MCVVWSYGVCFCFVLFSCLSVGAMDLPWWCWKQQADKQTSYKDLPRNMIPVPSTVNSRHNADTGHSPATVPPPDSCSVPPVDVWIIGTCFLSQFPPVFTQCVPLSCVMSQQSLVTASGVPQSVPSHAYFLSNNDICLPINWQMLTCLSSLLLGFQILI